MKTKVLVMLLLTPMLILAQVKGKKSKKSFTTSSGKVYNVGDMIQLNEASNDGKYAYAYINKSMLSLKNITKVVKSVSDVKNMKVSDVNNLRNNLETINSIAKSDVVSGAMAQLMGQAVSESYVTENALDASMNGNKYKIKNFKVYTDKASGQSIVHAIAKGNGKTVAILLDFAEKTGEIVK